MKKKPPLIKKDITSSAYSKRFAVGVFFFISGFNFAAWAARIPSMQKQLHLNDAELGNVLTALPTGLMFTMPFAGILLNKLRGRNVMLISAITYTFLLCFLSIASNTWEAMSILFLFGASRNLFNISINTQAISIQALFSKSIITTFHGVWSLAALAGAALSFLLISFSISMLHHFLIVALISVILISIVFKHSFDHDDKQQYDSKSLVFAWPDKFLIKLGMIGFASMVCEGTMSDWSGIYFSKIMMVSDKLITIGYVAYLAAMVSGRFLGDWLINRMGVKKLLQLSSRSIVIGFLIAILLPYLPTAILGFMMIGFGVSCIMPLVFVITPKVSIKPTGHAIAAVSTVSYLGFLSGPPIVGYIAHATNLKWSFLLAMVIAASMSFIISKIRPVN